MKQTRRWITQVQNERGSLLLIVYFALVAFLGIGAAFLLMTVGESRVVERQRISTSAFYIAEAGIEQALSDLRQDYAGDANWANDKVNKIPVNPSEVDFFTLYSSRFNGGDYIVQLKNVGQDQIWVRAYGTFSGLTQGILVYAKMIDANPWNNAIFAGRASVGGLINGNVAICGSVHILGQNDDGTYLKPTDLAAQLGGTADFVANNYSTLASGLKYRIPTIKTYDEAGTMIETLNATLRVKHGQISLIGNSRVGDANQTGNAYKEMVDGVYATDGFTSGSTSAVHSDNGYTHPYDMGDDVAFPKLSDAYTAPNGTKYSSYTAYMQANSVNITNQLSNIGSTAIDIKNSSGVSVFKYIPGDKKTPATLEINGNVYVGANNNFVLNSDVTYTGTGVVYVEGNVTFNNNMVTPTRATQATTYDESTFPKNVMGIVTPNTITLQGAQNSIMGAFYAGNKVDANKQYNIIGSIVVKNFDFADNVPAIYQVPELKNRLPSGMIGSISKSFTVTAWERI
jgi:hypothetical protein